LKLTSIAAAATCCDVTQRILWRHQSACGASCCTTGQ